VFPGCNANARHRAPKSGTVAIATHPYNDGNPAAKETVMPKEMKEFAGLYYREGALDPKTMQLVALAAMAAAGCTS
jgi:alkylhydroperoxidase/carboxymuconolactone decarboxylase family protein YurZ